LSAPDRISRGRALTSEEIAMLGELTFEDFLTPDRLAKAAGVTIAELAEYRDHPIVRLRHF
jgi:hypothetical protein